MLSGRTFLKCILNMIQLLVLGFAAAAQAQQVVLVEQGRPKAVVILPDKTIPAQDMAAKELIYHVHRATGAELPLCRESEAPKDVAYKVNIGPCKATKEAGIDTESLPPSGHVVRTKDNALFLAGRDRDRGGRLGHYWQAGWQGTLYAVYDLLETEMGIRWLFPGELGENIPRRTDLAVGPIDRSGKPRFLQTWLRPAGKKDFGYRPGWSSQKTKDEFHDAQLLFLLRHRFGSVENLDYGHAFGKYWKRFGKTHPEYFSLLPDGTRRPLEGDAGGKNVTMCVSNPGFRRQILEDWKKSRERNPDHVPYRPRVNACENDSPGMCTCPNCRAWDAPDPALQTHTYWGKGIIPDRDHRFLLQRAPWGELEEGDITYEPPSVSDRYARYYMKLLREVRRIDPDAKIQGYVYANYRTAPVNSKGDLNLEGVTLEFVPAVGFPYTEEMSHQFRSEWQGWRKLGATLVLRPNLTYAGANLPIFYARQVAGDFAFAAKNGMIGARWDSLLGAWSAQGPTLYVLTRMHEHPDWPVEKMLDEYYSAFGPAEKGVRAYFGYWENFSDHLNLKEFHRYCSEEKGGSTTNYVRIAHRLFVPEDFVKARALLEKTRRQAEGDETATRRVNYLELGLTDAELTTATRAAQAAVEKNDTPANRAAFKEVFDRLVKHRKTMEASGLHPSNLGYFSSREYHGARWPHMPGPSKVQLQRESEFQKRWLDKPLRDPAKAGFKLVSRTFLPREDWLFRKDRDRNGETLGWQNCKINTREWKRSSIETPWSTFLGEPFVGVGWYRRSFDAPKLPKNGAVYLQFGGVDEICWVWVNGQYVGRHHIGTQGWNVPFRLEVTSALKPGKNQLAVRVVNEIGVGGIWRPVRLEVYEPASKPSNVKK